MNWYYDAGGGNRQGPVTEAALDELLATGAIASNTLVWREGMTDWAPLNTARTGLAGAASPAASPSTERCDACGLFFPASELITIGSSNVCASCKPAVLQRLQQGGELPALDRIGPAWEQRGILGTFKAAMDTIRAVLTTPVEAFSTMRREGGLGKPLLFYMLLGTIGGIAGVLYNYIFSAVMPQPQQNSPFPGFNIPVITNWMMFGLVLMLPLFIALGTFIYAGVFHLSLMICGGARQPFETTFRVVAYTSGSVSIIQLVPVCGSIIAFIWSLVCFCIGFSKAHEISTGRAVGAVLLPVIACCIGITGLIFAIVGAIGVGQGMVGH